MELCSFFLWWGGTLLLAGLLWRMVSVGLHTRLPFFTAYLGGALTEGIGLLFFQPVTSHSYLVAYWSLEFLTAVLSFGIPWQGYTEALAAFPGVRKMARAALGILFAIVGAKTLVALVGNALLENRHHDVTTAISEFERDLRLLLALSLLALAGLAVHYAIPIGRNVLFMVIGYGAYLGVRVATLNVLFDSGLVLRPWVNLLLQAGWNIAAVIWFVGMWSYAPTPSPEAPLECDYERSSRQTMRALGQIREYVVHCWRS
jgi:hypothetical protein